MPVGKEIKVSLSLDDSGFSVKLKGAGDKARQLQKDLGGLAGQTDKTEAAIAEMAGSLKGFAENFGALQKSLTASIDTLTKTVAKSFTDMSSKTRGAAKEAQDAATAQIEARKRALQGEIDTNQKLLAARVKNHADLRRVEQEASAKALAAQIKADEARARADEARKKKKASAPAVAAANEAEKEAARLRNNAAIAAQQVALAERGLNAMAAEQNARRAGIATLEQEAAAARADAAAKAQLAAMNKAIGESNKKNVEKAQAAAAARASEAAAREKKNAEDGARLRKQLSDREVADMREAEREKTRAARQALAERLRAEREAAAERTRLAREEAARQRAEAKAVADLWRGMASMYAGAKIEQGLKSSVVDADDDQRARIMVQALNLPKAEEDALFADSQRISDQLKFASTKDTIKSKMSAISSLGYNSVGVIDDTLPTFMKAANNMEMLGVGHGDMQSTLRNIYGVTEMRQQTADSSAMLRTADLLNKSFVGTAGKVNLADVETALRRVGTGAPMLSDAGLVNLVGLIDQFKVSGGDGGSGGGVSTVGTIIKMMQAYATGKTKSNKAVQETIAAGILDEGGLDLSKDDAHVLKDAKNGNFKNVELWMKDPVRAIQEMVPQIVEYTKKHQKEFYQGRDPNSVENQMIAVQQYLQKMGITQSAVTAVTSVGTPAARERLEHQSATINRADTVDQTAERLSKSYAGNMQQFQSQLTNFKVIIGDTLLPALTKVLEYGSKFVIMLRDLFQNSDLARIGSTVTAVFGGIILSVKGFMSMFGSAGLMGALRSFVGMAPSVAGGAGIMAGAFKLLGVGFKWMAGAILAWDVGYMIGTWLSAFKAGSLTIGQYVENMFNAMDYRITLLMLKGEEWMAKWRGWTGKDTKRETAGKLTDIAERRVTAEEIHAMTWNNPDDKKPAAKKDPTKPETPKVGDPTSPGNETLANRLAAAGNKGAKPDRDPLNKALGEELGRMNQAKIKLDALVAGGQTIESLREEATALVRGKWEAGDYSKNHSADPKDRPDWNGERMKRLRAETEQTMLYKERVKAVEYANERVAAATLEADRAMNTLEAGGLAKETDAFKALSKELARTEERLGAGTNGFEKWNIAKSAALYNQARADNLTHALSYVDKNKETAAQLLDTDKARIKAQLNAQAAAEDAQIAMRERTVKRMYDIQRKNIVGATLGKESGIETEEQREEMLLALDANYQRQKDDADKQYSERRRLRREEEERALEAGTARLAREWKDIGKGLDDAGVAAANGFVSMLTSTLGTGRMEFGKFVKDVLMDIANVKLKAVIADPMNKLISQGTDWIKENVFGMVKDASAATAATAKAAADTNAAAASTTMSSVIYAEVIPALQMMAANAAGGGSAGGIGGFLSGVFGGGAGAAEASTSAGSIAEFMFANGGIMTSMGPMNLRKYANGGIANSPQLALYGEAGPEAYVPLPDGRTIPVTMNMQGGGQQQQMAAPAVQVNVINQTSQGVNASQGQPRFDGKQMILDVVLTAASQPGTFRSGMKEAMK